MISPRHLEGIARELLEATALEPPIDAFAFAQLCGLEIRPWGRASGALIGETIRYPIRARPQRQHGIIAHELGHWALRRIREEDRDEDAARYLAGALLVPREALVADLRRTSWDLDRLRELHPNASAEMIVVRMTQVSPATASVWDSGKLHRIYGHHDAQADRDLVYLALERERPVNDGDASAWPVLDGTFRRVLVVRRAS